MARIPDQVIERLKQEVPLDRLAAAHGVKLKQHGADLLGLCPFHEDREPSLVISPKKNLWHCLGACQTGGTVIDWVMRAQGVSFRHAVELLRSDHPALLEAAAQPVKQSTVRKLPPPIARAGSPLFSSHSVSGGPRRQGFAHAGYAALDCSGPPQGRLSVTRKGGC